jgi:hypothetical protein
MRYPRWPAPTPGTPLSPVFRPEEDAMRPTLEVARPCLTGRLACHHRRTRGRTFTPDARNFVTDLTCPRAPGSRNTRSRTCRAITYSTSRLART